MLDLVGRRDGLFAGQKVIGIGGPNLGYYVMRHRATDVDR
jgi:hypothetical protein